jgi:hypothetical protein
MSKRNKPRIEIDWESFFFGLTVCIAVITPVIVYVVGCVWGGRCK